MFWFDRNNPDVTFGDNRRETKQLCDGRALVVDPDQLMDFTDLPFGDNTFNLIAFDPPHIVRAGPNSWQAAKYGKLRPQWQEDIAAGFSECFRVLRDDGTLVFKWNETQIKMRDVLCLSPYPPLFGHRSGRGGLTHWYVFMKPLTRGLVVGSSQPSPERSGSNTTKCR